MKQKAVLDQLYTDVERVILARQHPVTGLLPASTAINQHGNYTDAWVRDNVYSIMCVWGLGLAYRHAGDKVREDRLLQCTVKLMRGLLLSMMRQSHKVEAFKYTLAKEHALHAKYDTDSGLEVVADDAWGHLQIDATSLYLLMLAQMSATGLRIVVTLDEVDFVQNLVYYIASAYRTPDFGIWERGNKINNGKTEINASSVGMAKAALQAMDNFNLFGIGADPRAAIHSVADAISLARATLAGLLPRESLSKETDSALLSIIGFPAFAVSDRALVIKTRDDILSKLGGNYGCKRFLWDGHQTALEEGTRLYYEHSELANFENIESEWPLFFTYLYIHALFDGNETTAAFYRDKLDSLMVKRDNVSLLPELYYVPLENVEAEKHQPKSQPRLPNDNIPLVWAQSLYWLGYLLDEGFVSKDDLDPLVLRRRGRQTTKAQVALVVLAESEVVKQRLADRGIISEKLEDIAPLRVISAPELVETYTQVGANDALRLTGRPRRRLQSLATSQTYQLKDVQYLSLSWLQSEHNDYRSADGEHVAKSLLREINHILSHWASPQVAVFTWLVHESVCNAENAEALFSTLQALQRRTQHEQVGYASAHLAVRASRINRLAVAGVPLTTAVTSEQPELAIETLPRNVQVLLECLELESDLTCYQTAASLLAAAGNATHLGEGDSKIKVVTLLQYLYARAQRRSAWMLARYCYAALGSAHMDLADGLTMLAVRHLSLVLGRDKTNTLVVDSPKSNAEIIDAIYKFYPDPLERTLVQELLSVIGALMRTEPRLFDGLRSIRVQTLLERAAEADEQAVNRAVILALGGLSPAKFKGRVRAIFASERRAYTRDVKAALHPTMPGRGAALDIDWFEWRATRGAITRLDDEFLNAIWQSLGQAHCLVFGDSQSQECLLDSEAVRTSMTAGEVSFARHVDQVTQHLHPPYYKSAVLEALWSFSEYCKQHPDVRFERPLLFTHLLERAAKSYVWDNGVKALDKRDLDVLLEQSPAILQRYVIDALEHQLA